MNGRVDHRSGSYLQHGAVFEQGSVEGREAPACRRIRCQGRLQARIAAIRRRVAATALRSGGSRLELLAVVLE